MTQTAETSTKVVIGPVRLSYANIWEPKHEDGKKPSYQTAIIIPKSDTKTIEAIRRAQDAAKIAGIAKLGGKVPANVKVPLRDGDEDKPDNAEYANSYFLNAKSNNKPGIVDKNRQPIIDKDEVYSGCWVYISLNFYAFNFEGKKGIGAGLGNIMKFKDDEALAGGSSAESDFAELQIEVADDLLG